MWLLDSAGCYLLHFGVFFLLNKTTASANFSKKISTLNTKLFKWKYNHSFIEAMEKALKAMESNC